MLVVAAVAAAASVGCGDQDRALGPSLKTDELRGTFDGVGIGDDKAAVRRRFGDFDRFPQAYPIEPLEIKDDGGSGGSGSPWSVVTGPHHLGPGGLGGEQVTLRYRGASFFVRDDRVFGFLVTDPRGQTRGGVGIGDDLSEARDQYPNFDCEEESQGDTTAVRKAACSGQVPGGRYLYFGGDPIESITVMERSVRFYDY